MFGCNQAHNGEENCQLVLLSSPFFKILFKLFVYVVEITVMSNIPQFISCKAKFINDDVIELPFGREFLAKPCKARGDYFVTFYFGWHNQIELVKLVDMKDLRDFKGD